MSNTIFWRCLTALILLPFLPLAIGLSLGQFALYLIRTAWRVWLSLIGWGEGLANTRISVAPLSDADDVIQLPLDEMLSDGQMSPEETYESMDANLLEDTLMQMGDTEKQTLKSVDATAHDVDDSLQHGNVFALTALPVSL